MGSEFSVPPQELHTAEIRLWRQSCQIRRRGELSESRDKISPRAQAPFSLCTTYVAAIYWTNLSVSSEAKYWVSWLKPLDAYEHELYELWKQPWIRHFVQCNRWRNSRWPHGRKAYLISALYNSPHPGNSPPSFPLNHLGVRHLVTDRSPNVWS